MGGYHELELVTLLALLEYSILGAMVGRARQTYGVEAPATTGNPDFERYFRVHENTLEALIVFIPAFWIFSLTRELSLRRRVGGVVPDRAHHLRARLLERGQKARTGRHRDRRNQRHPGAGQPDLDSDQGHVSEGARPISFTSRRDATSLC